jgi:hypothetical protein
MNDSKEKKNLSLKITAIEKQEARQLCLALKAASREAAKKQTSSKARKRYTIYHQSHLLSEVDLGSNHLLRLEDIC